MNFFFSVPCLFSFDLFFIPMLLFLQLFSSIFLILFWSSVCTCNYPPCSLTFLFSSIIISSSVHISHFFSSFSFHIEVTILIFVPLLIFYISDFRLFCLSYFYQYLMSAFSSSFFQFSHPFVLFAVPHNFSTHVVPIVTWVWDSIPSLPSIFSIELHNEYVINRNVNRVRPFE